MSKFNIGDRVRIVDVSGGAELPPYNLRVGEEDTIYRVTPEYVYLQSNPHIPWWPVRFELVKPRMPTRAEVYACIDGERDYQDSLASTSENEDGHHTYAEFLLYIDDYVQQAKRIASTTWGPDAKTKTLDVLRKVTALGVACMEQNGVVERVRM